MNAKKLKKIRRLARQTFMEESRLLAKRGIAYRVVTDVDGDNSYPYEFVQAVNDPKTQRGFYRMLKKTIK